MSSVFIQAHPFWFEFHSFMEKHRIKAEKKKENRMKVCQIQTVSKIQTSC